MLRSCRAQWLTPPPQVCPRPAPPRPGWMPNFSVSSQKRLKSWVWSGLHQRSPLAAVWMSGFCRGAVRPLNNDHRRSSLKFTTSSRDLGAPLTLPASVLPLHLPSLRLTALKKRDMRGCLNWMSQWLHISAHPLPSAGRQRPVTRPSHAGPLQRLYLSGISFLGTVLDSAHMRAVIVPERALAIQKLAATFKSDTTRPLKVFQRMLGLMAAASPVLQLGLLRMRPLHRWLKPQVPHNAWHHGRLHIRWIRPV